MEDLSLMIDLHKRQQRQGPGSFETTARAVELAGLRDAGPLRIADIGCGTGAASVQLAQMLDAHVTAVDMLPEFIDVLKATVLRECLSDRVETLVASMEQLPFTDGQFDVIWSEGAIYNMGFAEGVSQWRRFLRPGGVLVASEITWLSAQRPEAVQSYWEAAYPGIATEREKCKILEDHGYSMIGTFTLPESCWMDNYYRPLQQSFEGFLARHADDPQAVSLVEAERAEIDFYEQYRDFYSYVMYVARVTG